MNTNIKLIIVIVVSSLITLSLLYGLSIGTYKSVMRCSKERAVTESSKSRKPCEPCKNRTLEGDVNISERTLGVKGWEGQLWRTADGTPLGLAVRKTEIEVGPRLVFVGMTRTEWGWCNSWSEHSPGGYCLILVDDLRDRGPATYRMYSDPKIYNVLP